MESDSFTFAVYCVPGSKEQEGLAMTIFAVCFFSNVGTSLVLEKKHTVKLAYIGAVVLHFSLNV